MSQFQQNRRSSLLVLLVVTFIAGAAVFPWVSPGLYWGDFPELATAAASLGIPHGPGYPTYTLLASLFVQVLPTDPVHAANLASWFFGALTCGLAAQLVFYLLQRFSLPKTWSVILAGLWGLSQLANLDAFPQALSSEVYTLNTAFLWLSFLLVCFYLDDEDIRWAYLWAFITGLAAGNHLLGSLAAPGLLLALVWRMKKRLVKLPFLALFFTLGLSVYIVLPLRSFAGAPLDWGIPHTLDNFLWTVLNRGFMEGKFEYPISQVLMAAGMLADLIRDRVGWLVIILAFGGLGLGWRLKQYRPLWMSLVLGFLFMVIFVVNNIAPVFEWTILSIPTYAVIWLLALFGLLFIWEKWLYVKRWGIAVVVVLGLGGAFLPFFNALPNLIIFNKAGNLQTNRIVAMGFQHLPYRSVLIMMSSTDYFAMQNRQIVYKQRPDMDIAFGMLLRFEWARKQFHAQVKDFNFPAHFGVNPIFDYCSTPQSSRPLYFEPANGVMDRYLAVDLVPWGLFYLTGEHLATRLAEYLPQHERMLAEANSIMAEKADIFTPAQAAEAAEARVAYYICLYNAAREAYSLLAAPASSRRELEEKLSHEDPPTALELAREIHSQAALLDLIKTLDLQGKNESHRLAFFRVLIAVGVKE